MPDRTDDEEVKRGAIGIWMDGEWTARDLSRVLRCVDSLYAMRFVLQDTYDEWKPIQDELRRSGIPPQYVPWFPGRYGLPTPTAEDIIRGARALPTEEALSVKRLDFASPGLIILAGVVTAVGSVAKLLATHVSTHRRRQLEDAKLKAETRKLDAETRKLDAESRKADADARKARAEARNQEVAGLREYLELTDEMLFPRVDHRKLQEQAIAQLRPFNERVEHGQITDVKFLPMSDADSDENNPTKK